MSGALYPHLVIVSTAGTTVGAGGGSYVNGVWTPAPAGASGASGDELWRSPALVDDRGRGITRDQAGAPTQTSEAVAFCQDALPADIPDDALVHIHWTPGVHGSPVSDAVVMKVNRLENSLDLRRV